MEFSPFAMNRIRNLRPSPDAVKDHLQADTIAARLLAVRKACGISQQGVAGALGATGFTTTKASVSNYEKGTTVPSEYSGAFCVTFGIAPKWLLLGSGPIVEPHPDRASVVVDRVREILREAYGETSANNDEE